MNHHYWSYDSWGNGFPPTNYEQIIAIANSMIDEWIAANPDAPDYEIREFSDRLWEDYCATDTIDDVRAIYEEEED